MAMSGCTCIAWCWKGPSVSVHKPSAHEREGVAISRTRVGEVGELFGRSCEEGRGSVRVSADAGCAREQTKRQADALLQFGWFDKWGDASLVPRARCRRIQSSERSEIRTAGLQNKGTGREGSRQSPSRSSARKQLQASREVENKPRWGIL